MDESGRWTGTTCGEFVNGGRSEVRELTVSGKRISCEAAHRIAGLRMRVKLGLQDGALKGEALPIDFEENHCDIVLQ